MSMFKPAVAVKKPLKILVYGEAKLGKTRGALTFPRAAVFDTERGTHMWRGREGVPAFDAFDSRSVADLYGAIDEMLADNGKQWDTFIVDSLTIVHQTLLRKWTGVLEAKAKNGKDGGSPWPKVNQDMRDIYNRITDIKHQNVIVVAHEATAYKSKGGFFEAVGIKPDLDDSCRHYFDYVVHMTNKGRGIIEDQRGFIVANEGQEVPFNWTTFEPAALAYVKGEVEAPTLPSEAESIRTDLTKDRRAIPVPEAT